MKQQSAFAAVVVAAMVVGAFLPAAARAQTGLSYYAITPCRVVDTRTSIDPATVKRGTFTDGETRAYTFSASTNCPGLPSNAGGWAVHLSYRPASVASYLTVYPAGAAQPATSTLLGYPGSWTGSNAIVPAGTNGIVDLYCQYAGDLIIDVNGYFAP
jgi:hypothetical protein